MRSTVQKSQATHSRQADMAFWCGCWVVWQCCLSLFTLTSLVCLVNCTAQQFGGQLQKKSSSHAAYFFLDTPMQPTCLTLFLHTQSPTSVVSGSPEMCNRKWRRACVTGPASRDLRSMGNCDTSPAALSGLLPEGFVAFDSTERSGQRYTRAIHLGQGYNPRDKLAQHLIHSFS